MEDMQKEAVQKKLAPIALKMFKRGDRIEIIADFLEISIEEVQILLKIKND